MTPRARAGELRTLNIANARQVPNGGSRRGRMMLTGCLWSSHRNHDSSFALLRWSRSWAFFSLNCRSAPTR